ncbi:hypothetical protein AGOR_G00056200 [Albula goreensis]|uniref:Serine/arginine repetitive matrix protein 4 n=1 Tax=Albula goreensis TaxID=1534307 RepID=A0A8T3E360_9TELE|nr:hypothetical protein AGOR_G00056200 [Albula goreensis]
MASLQQGEKQLFEKFWRGTFKAVATPRPGSIIAASITARRTVTDTEGATGQSHKADQRQPEPADTTTADTVERNGGHIKARDRKRSSRRRMRSLSFDDDLTHRPTPKGKKKKKKSERKRRRKRSPSYSPSPVRKKKKKKSSKKRKRNRSASKKRRRSSPAPKSKRKEERKHKKRSRSHTHRRRRYRRSESESSAWRSSSTDSRHLRRSAERTHSESPFRQPGLRENGHGSMNQMGFEWRPVIKSTCTTPPNYRSAPPNGSEEILIDCAVRFWR